MAKRDHLLQKQIDTALQRMQDDAFSPLLGTHKLSGNLLGLWACSCGYDCRIIFALEKKLDDSEEVILLLDIGNHDEVY